MDKDIKTGCFGIVGLVVLFIIIVNIFPHKTIETPYVPSDFDAWYMAQEMFKRDLKSPASAVFAEHSESKIEPLSGTEWLVTSYVDSQNSFGAMLRTTFKVKMIYVGDKKWRMEVIKTDP